MRKDWEEGDWQQGTIFGDDWPVTPLTPVEFESDTFMIHAKDSVLIARRVDTVDVQGIRDALYDSSDYFMSKLVLRRMLDSSWVATLDSMVITKSVAVYPGYGLDSTLVKYKYPNGMPDDSVFVSIEILRGNTRDSLFRGFIETLREEDSASVAYKRSSGHDPTVNGRELTKENLTMTINPNPLNLTATVIFTGYEGCDAHIELFDLIGKKVLTLYDKEMEGSSLKLTLDGRILQSGMYLLRAQCGNSVITRKVELVK
jgi:hypothetical protein